jgi:hypothetical protein
LEGDPVSERVKDYDVERFLVWARNYKEIESYKKLSGTGARKWRIQLSLTADPITASGGSGLLLGRETETVPREFILTSREALAFGYGLAVAGSQEQTRAEFAKANWDW